MLHTEVVCLSVRKNDGTDPFYRYCQLPVQIGRRSVGGLSVLTLPGDPDVSRDHATIFEETNGLFIEDRSSNGTKVNNRRLGRGEREAISHGSQFYIGGFEITLHSGKFSEICLQWEAANGSVNKVPIFPGFPVRIGRRQNGCHFVIDKTDTNMSALHAELDFSEVGGKITNLSRSNYIYINNKFKLVAGGVRECDAGDVIMMGRSRLEIVYASKLMTECGNPDCRLLNEYKSEGECRWCGWHLSSGKTR